MAFPLHVKRRKSKGGSAGSDSQSWVYGMLCLGLIGFFGWTLWHTNLEQKPVNKVPKRKVVSSMAALTPVQLEKEQYKAVTNALNEFAQVAEKIKKMEPAPVQRLSDTNLIQTPIASKSSAARGPRPVETVLEMQIALSRLGIFPGSIDGRMGTQTTLALSAYQKQQGLPITGLLDSNTKSNLLLSAPITISYIITTNDLDRLLPVSKDWLGKSEQPRLDFETILELLGEKSFSNPRLIRDLNVGGNWDHVSAGTRVVLPSVEFPPITTRAAIIRISLSKRILEAFDSNTNLLVHFPCSIGHLAEKRPAGELRIETVALNPNYTFDPAVFPESEEAQAIGKKLILPPGPNNPVGVAWIGLNRPGYGIHGTPIPEQVGRTESHGCFRLANWNAEYLSRLVTIGMPVFVEP